MFKIQYQTHANEISNTIAVARGVLKVFPVPMLLSALTLGD
jgi:hypothetical protein